MQSKKSCFFCVDLWILTAAVLNLVAFIVHEIVVHNDHFPITKNRPFEYTLDSYNTSWRNYFQNYMLDRELDSDISAPLLIQKLRAHYGIPETWSDQDARAVIGLRYELTLRNITNLPTYVLLEDASNLLANSIFEKGGNTDSVFSDITKLSNNCKELFIVTISGLSADGYDGETADYIHAMDRLNQKLADISHIVIEMREGMPVYVKGTSHDCI